MADTDCMALLRKQLQAEGTSTRKEAVERVKLAALALGEEATRDALVPFLADQIDKQNDEVLVSVAQQLGGLVPFVGKMDIACLLEPLQGLAVMDETVVREAAVVSLNTVGKSLPAAACPQLVKVFQSLADKEKWYSGRVSAVGIASTVYERAEQPKSIAETFENLVHDETPMVRRRAATCIGGMATAMQKNDQSVEEPAGASSLFALLKELLDDDQESVRSNALLSWSQVVAAMSNPKSKIDQGVPELKKASEHRSWRLRQSVANNFGDYAKACGEDITKTSLLPIYTSLLKDTESEVRISAALQAAKVCEFGNLDKGTIKNDVLTTMKDLLVDPSTQQREKLMGVLLEISISSGKDISLADTLPLMKSLFNDENMDVRLTAIKSLGQLIPVIGAEDFQPSMGEVKKLMEDPNWRVRLLCVDLIPTLGGSLGLQFFNDNLQEIIVTCWTDSIAQIRRCVAECMAKLIKIFGGDWASDFAVPKFRQSMGNSNYLHRENVLYAIQLFAKEAGSPMAQQTLLPLVLTLCEDPVPNVLITAAITCEVLVPFVDESGKASLSKALQPLTTHSDPDVAEFSRKAMDKC